MRGGPRGAAYLPLSGTAMVSLCVPEWHNEALAPQWHHEALLLPLSGTPLS